MHFIAPRMEQLRSSLEKTEGIVAMVTNAKAKGADDHHGEVTPLFLFDGEVVQEEDDGRIILRDLEVVSPRLKYWHKQLTRLTVSILAPDPEVVGVCMESECETCVQWALCHTGIFNMGELYPARIEPYHFKQRCYTDQRGWADPGSRILSLTFHPRDSVEIKSARKDVLLPQTIKT